jgi:hypothetical protein
MPKSIKMIFSNDTRIDIPSISATIFKRRNDQHQDSFYGMASTDSSDGHRQAQEKI